ncbi:hypothetical protein SAMN05421788_103405 [Filimonas lacunae]|uniref:Uncharacterized protein n=1 Tax=Filimonas lacunae TaxID=477680 RepID=A0A173MKR4_9BACT|nr:hypothetical protein [Filimonas lacunae]BAV08067.1 hypothetical protein FLA_4100 [Filimonas lacunae]SIT08789.1 hypothetical protein SAMN05421788_103405 [Filimonas lacunae]
MLGFHGCDESIRNKLVLSPNTVKKSEEVFDWLGHGFYVWENNYERAFKWAKDKKKRGKLTKPAVLGVMYQLDNCLDLTDSGSISVLSTYYNFMKVDFQALGSELPKNKDLPQSLYHDLVFRELDCAVIEYMHQKIEEKINLDIRRQGFSDLKHFDTARGIFTEGGPAFEGAGIQSKNHIQICIRNLNCIKGFFVPRDEAPFPLNW